MALSPMMRQYFEVKEQYKEYILFYRVGDFYEMFYDDARTASGVLGLVLTGRDCSSDERAPMCGVPYHSARTYVARLLSAGYKVAICEQTEDPAVAKGLVKREVIRLITPGTLIESGILDEGEDNYLASVCCSPDGAGIAFAEVSAGQVYCTVCAAEPRAAAAELGRFSPRELIIDPGADPDFVRALEKSCGLTAQYGCPDDYEPAAALARVKECFGLGPDAGRGAAYGALSAMAGYIEDVYKDRIKFSGSVRWYEAAMYMSLGETAVRNLELEKSLATGGRKGSLLSVLDRTRTPMGKRLLGQWLRRPLTDCVIINKRLNAVQELHDDDILCERLREAMNGIYDLERLATRVAYASAGAREMRSLCGGLKRLPGLKEALSGRTCSLLKEICGRLDTLGDVCELIDGSISEDPPPVITEGGIIREGKDPEVDRLRGLLHDSAGALAAIEASEKEKTGIKQLKVGYNRVFGYYIEISKGNLRQVPDSYIRKQTLTTGERFVTPELKALENDILQAKTRLCSLEYRIFCEVRDQTAAAHGRLLAAASAVAQADVLTSLAQVAARENYCRPQVDCSGVIELTASRHPVVEQTVSGGFVPNDARLDGSENSLLIITGPNMAGKSTYMRQVALAAIMAQMGSFVAAGSAHIGVRSAVFTRVGASDDLAGGRSTFMVEMSELAYILKNADGGSLIILDEIGRGTSTFDGMSIARAVVEYLTSRAKGRPLTMFATHYHELCSLEDSISSVKNYNILVKKRGDNITFLRRIVRGGADSSYGIEVGRLAGVPEQVTRRAKQILRELEAGREKRVFADGEEDRQRFSEGEQSSFGDLERERLLQKLRNTDVDRMTPMEALAALGELAAKAREL